MKINGWTSHTKGKKLEIISFSIGPTKKKSLKCSRHIGLNLPNRSFQHPRDFFILKRESSNWRNL